MENGAVGKMRGFEFHDSDFNPVKLIHDHIEWFSSTQATVDSSISIVKCDRRWFYDFCNHPRVRDYIRGTYPFEIPKTIYIEGIHITVCDKTAYDRPKLLIAWE